MAEMGRRWHLRRWGLGFLALLAWMAFSLGWSWVLINQTFKRDIESRLISRATRLAQAAREQVQAATAAMPAPPPPEVHLEAAWRAAYSERLGIVGRIEQVAQALDAYKKALAARSRVASLEGYGELQGLVEWARRMDGHLAYAMIWTEEGKVLAHSRRELRLTGLDPTMWPELGPKQSYRISRLTVPDLSKEPQQVVEATAPVQVLDHTVALVSVAYSQDWIQEEFWRTQERVLLLAVGIAVAGLVVLFLVIHFSFTSMDRRRRETLQTSRARTSLLAERGMLASVLAHEVRSPLTALRFNLHSLRTLVGGRSTDVDRQVELTDRCEREIRRLDGMLNDFLQRTQVIGPVEAASVNTVVSEALEFLRAALERKNIRTSIHLDPSDPRVHVHPDELRQVILNLATNAHEAMPKGGTLAVSTVAEEGTVVAAAPDGSGQEGTVTILIRDSGTGIPPELHERIFEPFFSTKPQGSGLGLALVRRVVSGAGGTVYCESAVGGRSGGGETGTTFRIVLPRSQGEAAAGQGYAHVRREETPVFDSSPEIVIDKQEPEGDGENEQASSEKQEG